MVLDDVDFEGDLGLDQGLSHGVGLGRREILELVLQFPLLGLGLRGATRIGILIGILRDGGATPVSTVEDVRGPHVEEDHVVTWPEVVLHSPFHGEGTLVT